MSRDIVTVIKSVNYSEADKVLTVFGKSMGKFPLFAKGIRKINSKNRGNMQTLCTSDISFFEGKGLPVLTESQLLYSPDPDIVKGNVENIERVLILLNRVVPEYDPNPKVFDLLQSVLKKSFQTEYVNRFRVLFLKEVGFLQDFTHCNICGGKENLKYIDITSFALLCKNCYSKVRSSYELGENPYGKGFFTQALDEYVRRVIEEI